MFIYELSQSQEVFTVFLIISYILCCVVMLVRFSLGQSVTGQWPSLSPHPYSHLPDSLTRCCSFIQEKVTQTDYPLFHKKSIPAWEEIVQKKLMYTHLTEQVPLWDWCQNQNSLSFFSVFYMAWNLFKTFSKLHVLVQSLVNGLKAGKPHSLTLGPAGPGSPGSPASPASPWLWKKQQHLHSHNVCVLKRNRKQRSES